MNLTPRQQEAQKVLASSATHIMLEGGSRSGKTFLLVRAVCFRAIKAPKSRHVILRFRFNHIKASIIADTFPKVMSTCFPDIRAELSKVDWYATFPNGSEIWFGGLDDKERTEKILGAEYATVYLNEVSQMAFAAREMAMTRLAQKVEQQIEGKAPALLPLRAYYDWNPTSKSHWAYRLFHEKRNPETKEPLSHPADYALGPKMNPADNAENLNPAYLQQMQGLSSRARRRFYEGEAAEANPNALFADEWIDRWRVIDGRVPDMVRLVVGVDPSGSGDEDNADNDEIGIGVVGLGTDGNAYVLEDCSVKAGPATWGRISTNAFDRHAADVIVGEVNFGGEMVRQTILTARPRTPFKKVTASRGKVQRAEPFSSLYEQGKVRHVGHFPKLEDELAGFSTIGYVGAGSPNRADAVIWALAELFPGLTKAKDDDKAAEEDDDGDFTGAHGWMAG